MHLEVLKPDVHLLSNYYAGKSNLWFDVVQLDVQLLQAHLIPRVIYSYRLRTIQLPYKPHLNTCNTWSDLHSKVVKLDVQLVHSHVIPGLICSSRLRIYTINIQGYKPILTLINIDTKLQTHLNSGMTSTLRM